MPFELPVTRRDFLRTSTAAAVTALGTPALARPVSSAKRCIFLLLTGGPSHIDTFDPKPDAPSEVRGPFRPMRTAVPGIHLSDLLPRTAARMERVAIVRSLHHEEAPIHETGQQLLQTGRLCRGGREYPHFAAAVTHLAGRGIWGLVPGPLGDTGVAVSHGQEAGPLGARCEGIATDGLGEYPTGRYGTEAFGRHCALAVRLVETGDRCVVVNMFPTVYETLSWDCHADGSLLPTNLNDYRNTIVPMFDMAYSALLDDLAARGLLDTTLVVVVGEFGRTPYINSRGGRDHWPGVWSALFAGGGVRGGQVIGASDALGGEPRDRPVAPAEVTATIYHALGIDVRTKIPGPGGWPMPLVEAEPIAELF